MLRKYHLGFFSMVLAHVRLLVKTLGKFDMILKSGHSLEYFDITYIKTSASRSVHSHIPSRHLSTIPRGMTRHHHREQYYLGLHYLTDIGQRKDGESNRASFSKDDGPECPRCPLCHDPEERYEFVSQISKILMRANAMKCQQLLSVRCLSVFESY